MTMEFDSGLSQDKKDRIRIKYCTHIHQRAEGPTKKNNLEKVACFQNAEEKSGMMK